MILSSIGCAHAPVDTRFDGRWQACELNPFKTVMCLDEPDIAKLHRLLLQCGSSK